MRRVQNDTTSTSQATRNLVTNPEMAAALSDKILFRNAITNPSFEAASGTTTVSTNLLTNPGFETVAGSTNIWTNLATNPSFEASDGQVPVWRNLATNPTMEAVVASTTIQRTNLCVNPNFDVSLTGWAAQYLKPGYGRASVRSLSGTHSVWGVATDNIGDSMYTNNPNIPVTPNTNYTVSAYVWVPAGVVASDFRGGNRNLWAVGWTGTAATAIGSANIDFAKTNQWQRLSTTVKTGATTTELHVRLYLPANDLGVYWDNVLIEQTDQLRPYFDGSTPDARGWDYAWTGTATASTSTAAAAATEVARNVAPNPKMITSDGTTVLRRNLAPNPRGVTPMSPYGSGTISAVSITGHPLGITTANRVAYGANANNPGVVLYGPLQASTQYTVSAWIYHETAPESGGQGFAQSGITSMPSPPAIVAGQWERFSWTYTTGTSTSSFGFRVTTPSTAGSYLITGVLVEQIPRMEDYFDGTTTNTSDHTFGWVGTVDASESVMRGYTVADFTRSGGDTGVPQIITEDGAKILRYTYRTENSAIAINSTSTSVNTTMADKVYTVIAKVRTSINMSGLRLRLGGANAPGFDTVAGQWKTVTYTGVHPNTGYTSVWSPSLSAGQYGAILDIAEFSVIEGTYKSNNFDGSTPSEGEFNYAWVGTPNNSHSVKRGTRVLNVLASRNTAITDSQFHVYSGIENGERFVRYLSPAGTASSGWRIASSSGVDYAGIVAGETYTLTVKYRQTGWTNPTIMFGMKDAPATNAVMPDYNVTNVPSGTWQTLTRTFTALSSGLNTTLLYMSLPVTAPTDVDGVFDVAEWSLVPGTYAGPVFDGATPAAGDLTYGWVGSADTSASTTYGTTASGVVNGNTKSHQSTEWGRRGKSVKIIPLDVSGSTATSVSIPVTLSPGKTYTILATRYLDKPLVGTLNAAYGGKVALVQPGISTLSPATALPNVAGEATLRWTFTVDPAATGHTLRLGHGGNVSSGNVWWDDVLVVEGTYTGPYFDGSRPGKENLAKVPTSAFNGTVHTSNVPFAGSTWTRTTAAMGTSNHLTRQYVDKNELILGETYTASVTVANDQSFPQNVTMDWCDAGSVSYNIAPGEIRRISVTASRPAIGQWVYGDVYRFSDMHVTASPTESRSILFKDWSVEQGTTSGEYFTGTGDYTFTWNGTANASTSTQRAAGLASWGLATTAAIHQSSTVPSKFGTKCGVVITKGATGDGIYHNDVAVTGGTTYCFSIWVKATSVHRLDGVIRWKDASSATVNDLQLDVGSSLIVGSWTKVSISGTAPTNAVFAQPMWRIYTTHTPTTFYVDGAILTESTGDVEFFDGSNPSRKNVVENPSVETDTTNWMSYGGGLGATTTTRATGTSAYIGDACYRATWTSSPTYASGGNYYLIPYTDITIGDVYSASMAVRSSIGQSMRLSFEWFDGRGTKLSTDYGTVTSVNANEWKVITIEGRIAPPGAYRLQVCAYATGTIWPVGATLDSDALLVEKAATVSKNYYAGTGDFTYSWVGAANDSKSIKTAPTPTGMSGNYSGRVSWQSNEGPVPGKKSVAVISGIPNVDTFSQFLTPPFAGEKLGGRTFTMIGTRKTVDNLPASGNDGRAWKMLWQVTKSNGTVIQIMPPVGPTTAGVHKVKYTFTFDADVNTTTSFLRVYNGSVTPNTTVWWDDVAIIEGAYPGEYFDGSTTDNADFNYEWAGAVDASTSQIRAWNVAGTHTAMRSLIYASSIAPFSGASHTRGVVSEVGYFPRYEVTFPVKRNTPYTVMAKMRASTGPVSVNMKWIATPDTHEPVYFESASNGLWSTARGTSVSPNNADYLALWVGVPSGTALGTTFDIDQLMLVEGDYNGPFGTGDSYGWEWEGVPHASTSIGYPVGMMQLAGKPLFFQTTPGQYVLTDVDPAKNPVIPEGAPRTIYTVIEMLQDIPTGVLDSVLLYGRDDLSDNTPNTFMTFRLQSMAGDVSTMAVRKTGGSGPIVQGIPAGGKVVLTGGINENGKLFSGFNNASLVVDPSVVAMPHERIKIEANNGYHKHIATYIYPGVHSPAVRQEMVKLLAHEYSIPGM